MEDQFVPYELALKLKELGFDEPCIMYYNNDDYLNIGTDDDYWGDYTGFIKWNSMPNSPWKPFKPLTSAPLWQQAFDWFREKYGLYYGILNSNEYWAGKRIGGFPTGVSNSYEEARLECLKQLIKIVEND